VVAGTTVLSQHAHGLAIDLNPVENPWRKPDRIVPAGGVAFADRAQLRPGMIVRPGPVVAALDELGWEWGGDWRHAFDDHHVAWSRARYYGLGDRRTGVAIWMIVIIAALTATSWCTGRYEGGGEKRAKPPTPT